MKDLHTIDLTLRILCEAEDAARFALSSPALQAASKAIAQALALHGRFHVAPQAITWVSRGEADESAVLPAPP